MSLFSTNIAYVCLQGFGNISNTECGSIQNDIHRLNLNTVTFYLREVDNCKFWSSVPKFPINTEGQLYLRRIVIWGTRVSYTFSLRGNTVYRVLGLV